MNTFKYILQILFISSSMIQGTFFHYSSSFVASELLLIWLFVSLGGNCRIWPAQNLWAKPVHTMAGELVPLLSWTFPPRGKIFLLSCLPYSYIVRIPLSYLDMSSSDELLLFFSCTRDSWTLTWPNSGRVEPMSLASSWWITQILFLPGSCSSGGIMMPESIHVWTGRGQRQVV